MIRQTIRQWAAKLLEVLQRASAHITTLDEILLGAFLAFILLMILTLLGVFD